LGEKKKGCRNKRTLFEKGRMATNDRTTLFKVGNLGWGTKAKKVGGQPWAGKKKQST